MVADVRGALAELCNATKVTCSVQPQCTDTPASCHGPREVLLHLLVAIEMPVASSHPANVTINSFGRLCILDPANCNSQSNCMGCHMVTHLTYSANIKWALSKGDELMLQVDRDFDFYGKSPIELETGLNTVPFLGVVLLFYSLIFRISKYLAGIVFLTIS